MDALETISKKSGAACVETQVPARLDRLPWCGWHWMIITALGVTWILDGLEVTLASALGATLKNPAALGLTDAQVGGTATAYLAGAVAGALFFGYLTDRLGRKRLFFHALWGLPDRDSVLRALHGTSGASRFFARSRELASVANTQRSTRRLMS